MADDYMDLLDSKEQPFQEENKRSDGTYKPNGPKLNERTDLELIDLEKQEIHTFGREFGSYFFVPNNGELPEDVKDRTKEVFKYIASKDYKWRFNYGKIDTFMNSLLRTDKLLADVYLPWKKFNEDVPYTPVMNSPDLWAYRVAKSNHKAYDKVPPTVRTFLANLANVMFGKEGKNKVTFMLVYTPDGRTTMKDVTDFTILGNLPLIIKLAKLQGVPVLNIASKNTLEDIKKLIG